MTLPTTTSIYEIGQTAVVDGTLSEFVGQMRWKIETKALQRGACISHCVQNGCVRTKNLALMSPQRATTKKFITITESLEGHQCSKEKSLSHTVENHYCTVKMIFEDLFCRH